MAVSKRIDNVGILGIGSYLPEKILTNEDLEKMVDTSDEWISQRTGIKQRRILEDGVPGYTMGIHAAQKAISMAKINPEEIGLIIGVTNSPDFIVPTTACSIQKEIGAVNAAAFDLNAACSGFIYGISVGQNFIKSGQYKYVLVVSVETLSRVTDWKDRNTCVLFGDGSGAAVLGEVEEGYGIKGTYLGADGDLAEFISMPFTYVTDAEKAKRHEDVYSTIWQNGSQVFKFAVKIMESSVLKIAEETSTPMDQINYIIPHQANARIIEGAAKRLGIESDRVINVIEGTGNVSSACIPVAIDKSFEDGKIKKGDNIILVGFGGGLTWGSALIKWSI